MNCNMSNGAAIFHDLVGLAQMRCCSCKPVQIILYKALVTQRFAWRLTGNSVFLQAIISLVRVELVNVDLEMLQCDVLL